MFWFWIGVSLGVLIAVPLVAVAGRRSLRRVRALERRAQAAERLAEMGTMTGGLAHEIKNPLSTINLNLQLLREDVDEIAEGLGAGGVALTDIAPAQTREKVDRVRRRLDPLTREVQRLREILEDFLRFAGRVNLDRAPTDLNGLVTELADFFGPQAAAAGVRVRVETAPQPLTADADAGLLKQALLNLLINATQAMEEAQRLPGTPHGGARDLILRTERGKTHGLDEVHIHVIDTGPGIAPDRLDKIFQPYFSTKKNGSGLGLPTTKRIIQEHGGAITVHTDPGRGTDFTISLPVHAPAS
ncbi:MAG: two-component sensor histidine kinase [Planctomycetes bacterium]|nr:two-component sensor histidine kinase [Planctomycetota bacterium]